MRDGSLLRADRASTRVPKEVLVGDGDVIFSWSGTLHVKLWTGGRAVLNQHLFRVSSASFPRWFYYFWTKAHLAEFRSIANDKKTTMGHIKRSHLSAALANVPDQPVWEKASELMSPLLDRYILCYLQAGRLEALRDRLLRALMSGEVTLAEGAAHLEAVA